MYLKIFSFFRWSSSHFTLCMFQFYGFVVYRHVFKKSYALSVLEATGIRDRGYVLIDGVKSNLFFFHLHLRFIVTSYFIFLCSFIVAFVNNKRSVYTIISHNKIYIVKTSFAEYNIVLYFIDHHLNVHFFSSINHGYGWLLAISIR